MHSLSLLLAAAATAHASYLLPEPVATRDIPPLPTLFKREAFSEPCQEVAESWSAAKPLQTGAIYVPAKVAYDCLQTVPVDKEGDLKQIAELKLMLQFQSDLNYLKDGIKTHNAEPLDLLAELDEIAQSVQNETMKGEYEVQQSIRLLLLKAGDFHLFWTADIQTPLPFLRANGMLLAYSTDGVALPEVYYGLDPGRAKRFNFTPSPIETINGKNAVDFLNEVAFQNAYHDPDARWNRLFPNLPRQSMGEELDEAGPFVNPLTYPGETTELVFKNKTSLVLQNVATIGPRFSFANVTDGPSFFKQFCTGSLSTIPADLAPKDGFPSVVSQANVAVSTALPQQSQGAANGQHFPAHKRLPNLEGRDVAAKDSSYYPTSTVNYPPNDAVTSSYFPKSTANFPPIHLVTSTSNSSDAPSSTSTPSIVAEVVLKNQPTGYPVPVIVQSSRKIQCYYMNETGYEDVAVLVMPAFDPTIDEEWTEETEALQESQKVLREFFAGAVKDGKKKLIVDVRGNTGGTIAMGYEAFKQIFPDLEPYGATRYRANEAFGIFSSAIADFVDNGTYANIQPEQYAQIVAQSTTWDYQNILDENGTNFSDFEDYFGPFKNNKDEFTALRRYNFSNFEGGYPSSTEFNLTGYNDQAPAPTKRPFESDNIVVMTDGLCGSTCAIFTQFMREQGKVHTIAVGGRPVNGPMQGVGGTKGAQVIGMHAFPLLMGQVINTTEQVYSLAAAQAVNNTSVGKIAAVKQLFIRSAHTSPDNPIYGRVNSLDNIRAPRSDLTDDQRNTPLEFVYEAADCKLFYTLESLMAPAPLWKRAVDAKWGNGTCVTGSTGDPSSMGVENKIPFNKNESTPEEYQGAAEGLRASGAMMVVAAVGAMALLL